MQDIASLEQGLQDHPLGLEDKLEDLALRLEEIRTWSKDVGGLVTMLSD